MLHKIFDFQKSLIAKIRPVEQSLGYTPPQFPLDFTQRADQDWFRMTSWYLVEEITEAMAAKPDTYAEELADALHFAVELCILAGVEADAIANKFQLDLFESDPYHHTLPDVVKAIGLANQQLKHKPWKRNPQDPKVDRCQAHTADALFKLINHALFNGIDIYAEYFKKHAENETRVATGY